MDCLFCKIANKEIESKVLYEDDNYLAFLDIDQETEGHTLIIPKRHITDYTELTKEDYDNMFEIAKKLNPMLQEKLNKSGITMLFNYGDAQVIKHVHLHLLPNFLVEKSTKSQEEVYLILKSND